LVIYGFCVPIPVAARSRAWVCGRSLAGMVVSKPAGRMDVCVLYVCVHVCVCVYVCVCVFCQVQVSASGWSLVQRTPTECGVSECDCVASIMRRPWPTRDCCALGGGAMNFISTANQIRQRTEICGELEAVIVLYSRNYLAILLELLLFRYLNLLPDKYNLAHYSYIKSKRRKSSWPCKQLAL
jgi:hypothetical protein